MLTKIQAEAWFREDVLPRVKALYEKHGRKDWPARREAWNEFTDFLHKDRKITSHQYETWGLPACCRWRGGR